MNTTTTTTNNNETETGDEFTPLFEFAATETYTADVIVETPNTTAGWDKSKFRAEFLRIEVDEYEKLNKKTPVDVLERVLVGWKDMRAADRRSFVPYTPAHKAAFLKVPQAVLSTYDVFVATQYKGRAKN